MGVAVRRGGLGVSTRDTTRPAATTALSTLVTSACRKVAAPRGISTQPSL
jgi:hypothetical protein